jgi:hypothetical protein
MGSVAELRSINSGAIRRALENLQSQIGSDPFVVKGIYAGTATALPTSPKVNDLWVIGTPVPSLAPARSGGGTAQAGDGMVWNGTAWVNTGPTQGPPGSLGPAGPPGTQGPMGPPGAQGIPGPDEVWIGAATPGSASQELWVDTDEDPTPAPDEVWISSIAPVGSTQELWVDVDEDPPPVTTGTDEVWISASTPSSPTLELWVDVDEDPTPSGSVEEVWIGPTAPVGAFDLWVDTS